MHKQQHYQNQQQYDNTTQPSHSTRLNASTHLQSLCKITFDLDQQSQELHVYEHSTLKELTEQLIDKLTKASLIEEQDASRMTNQEKDVLKGEIKSRIMEKMDQNVQKSLQAARWRNKLKDIIDQKIRTPMDSLVSPSTQRQTLCEGKTKSVSYFKYNQPQSEQSCRQREIIQRMRILDKEIRGESKNKLQKRERLYDLGKRTQQIKEYLYKAHEYQTLQEELSQCTFHPNIRKINNQSNTEPHSDVFARLYNEAADKKEKIKRIESELLNRKLEQEKNLNFIPRINQCSKEIVMAKKEQKINIYDSLYQQANVLKEQKNKFQPQYTFHPTISAKSQKIVKNISSNKLNTLNQNSTFSSKKNLGRQSSQISLHWLGLKTQHSKSPIKDNSKKRIQKMKANRGSEVSIKQFKKEQETIKKINYQREKEYESQQTLKLNIFSKKPFKKNKNLNKNQHCYVQPKDIKRQKITILDQTQVTCNTQESLPTTSKGNFYNKNQGTSSHISKTKHRTKENLLQNDSESSMVMSMSESKGFQKEKKKGLNPLAFFKEKEKQKINNKQNIQEFRQQDKNVQIQFHKRKNKIFQEIFAYLLHEAELDSQITYQVIIGSPSIPQSLKHVFYPMAQEMRDLGVGLDQQQFIWSMIRIFDSLSLQQRGLILGWGLKLEVPTSLKTTKLR